MIYLGSKAKLSDFILSSIFNDMKSKNQTSSVFVDAFCGGGNLIQFVPSRYVRIASDINKYTVSFLNKIQEDVSWIPQNSSEYTIEDYKFTKNSIMKGNKFISDNSLKYHDYFIAHVGYNLSYSGKFFGGFRQDKSNKRDYVKEAYNHTLKQLNLIQGITFYHRSYEFYSSTEFKESNCIIYCDIPYKNTTKYDANDFEFDYSTFYEWCKYMTNVGHNVYISEYSMPEEFKIIASKDTVSKVNQIGNSSIKTEKIFTL